MSKRVTFLYGMVTGTFKDHRTYRLDLAAEWMESQLAKVAKQGEPDDALAMLAECLTFTESLEFNWRQDVPAEIRALEDFWKFNTTHEREPAVRVAVDDIFKRFCELNTVVFTGVRGVTMGWYAAVREALAVWTPPAPEWNLESELTPEERRDPLFDKGESTPESDS